MFEGHRYERFPSNAINHRELGSDLPCVLCIDSEKVLRQIFGIRIGLPEKSDASDHKVGQAGARRLSVELKRRDAPGIGNIVQKISYDVSAESILVRSSDDADVIIHAEEAFVCKLICLANASGRGSNRKPSRDRHSNCLRNVTVGVNADLAGTEEIRAERV